MTEPQALVFARPFALLAAHDRARRWTGQLGAARQVR